MPVDDAQELGCIRQPHAIEPAARHRHRMVVQAHHAMARAGAGQGLLERGEGRRAQGAAGRARQAAVEQHDTPAPQVDETAEHEGLSGELALHGLGLVVIAGQAQHRQPQRTKQAAEVRVSRRVILHEITGHQQRIRWPVARTRVGQRRGQRRQRRHSTQRFVFVAVEVRVGKVSQTHCAHDGSVAEPLWRRQ